MKTKFKQTKRINLCVSFKHKILPITKETDNYLDGVNAQCSQEQLMRTIDTIKVIGLELLGNMWKYNKTVVEREYNTELCSAVNTPTKVKIGAKVKIVAQPVQAQPVQAQPKQTVEKKSEPAQTLLKYDSKKFSEKEYYEYLKENKYCVKCKTKMPKNSKYVCCAKCRAKMRVYERTKRNKPNTTTKKSNRSSKKMKDMATYNEKKRLGLCVKCGNVIADGKHATCTQCRDEMRIAGQKRTAYRQQHNLCTSCGAKLLNKKYRTCAKCRKISSLLRNTR